MQLSEYVEIWDTILFRVYNVIARLKWFVLPWNIKKIVRRNKVFKNKYKGERCFVLLNGPSLKEHDLSALKDEIVFTTNYFYNSTLADVVKPNYHCWLDSLLVSENKDNKLITDIRAKIKNIPLLFNIKGYYGDLNNVFYTYNKHLPGANGISHNLAGLSSGFSTVAFYALNAALYMGFSKIYVLGLDFAPGAFKHFDESMDKCDNPQGASKKVDVCGNYWSYTKAHYEAFALNKEAKKRKQTIINLNPDSFIRAFEFDEYERIIRINER